MRPWKVLVGTSVLVVSLAACGGVPAENGDIETGSNAGLSEVEYKLSDGRVVTCILYDGLREASVSCDWEDAK